MSEVIDFLGLLADHKKVYKLFRKWHKEWIKEQNIHFASTPFFTYPDALKKAIFEEWLKHERIQIKKTVFYSGNTQFTPYKFNSEKCTWQQYASSVKDVWSKDVETFADCLSVLFEKMEEEL